MHLPHKKDYPGSSPGHSTEMIKLINLMKLQEDTLMKTARVVSNMKRPESDNDYGRAASKIKEAREALEKLQINS